MFYLAADVNQAVLVVQEFWSKFDGGSEFFTHTTFTVLASATVSSRIREYLITPPNNKFASLKKEIQTIRDRISANGEFEAEDSKVMESAIEDCMRDVISLESSLQKWIRRIEVGCKIICWILLFFVFALIVTDNYGSAGFLPLLALLPLWIARSLQRLLYWNANNAYDAQEKRFDTVKKLRQAQYDAEQNRAFTTISKFLNGRANRDERRSLEDL